MSNSDPFLISTEELASRLNDGSLALFDATVGPVPGAGGDTPAAQAFEAGHIPSARWLDQALLSDSSSPFGYMAPAPDAIAAAFEKLGVGPQTEVVLYSASSAGWPARVWWLLHSIGFDSVRLLDGGLQKWRAEGRELVQGASASAGAVAPGSLTVTPREVFVGRERVLQAVHTGDAYLVDSLSAAQYRGEVPNKFGRRGHIQGALSVPSTELLDPATKGFKDPAASKAVFEAAGVGRDNPLITYCGGGIAASVDALAALRGGFDDVRIYDASLNEWGADDSLPLVTETA